MNRPRRLAAAIGWLVASLTFAPSAVRAQMTVGSAEASTTPSVSLGLPLTNSSGELVEAPAGPALGQPNLLPADGPLFHEVHQPGELPPPQADLPPPGYRQPRTLDGLAQKPFTIDWVYFGKADASITPAGSVKMSELGASYQRRLPIRDSCMFTLRPFMGVTFLSMPQIQGASTPDQLYRLAIDLQLDHQFAFNENFGISLGITPGIWTDFAKTSGEDFRLPARVLGTYKVYEGLFIAAGVDYTDNFYRNILPAGGVIWIPNETFRVELVYPRSRVVYRQSSYLQIYGLFERGGDTYNVSTQFNNADYDEDLQYKDYRVMLGVQFDYFDRVGLFGEVGWAFDRLYRFSGTDPTTLPARTVGVDSALVLRVGARF